MDKDTEQMEKEEEQKTPKQNGELKKRRDVRTSIPNEIDESDGETDYDSALDGANMTENKTARVKKPILSNVIQDVYMSRGSSTTLGDDLGSRYKMQ
jgi:hypothetical protein